ncbi:MAG: AraC family transcriptional regulator [Clostridia bacterium]|nr:AraC family transcriptional regulator [Clostridia bacterium]
MNTFFTDSIRPKKRFEIHGIYTSIDKACDTGFEFNGESHPFWELLYVKDGVVEVIEEENTYVLYGGTMICHAPGEFHRIKSVKGAGARIHVLTIDHSGVLPENIKNGVFALPLELRAEYEKCFAKLYYMCYEKDRNKIGNSDACSSNAAPPSREAGNPNKIGHEGLARLTVFLLSLANISANEEMLSTSRGAAEYSRIVSVMQDGVDDCLSLEQIAQIRHVSKSYVTKLFKSYAGEGPMQYYARIRIARIQSLLLGGYSLSEIAEKMGFSSLSYLSAFFKERCKISASEWLARAKEN